MAKVNISKIEGGGGVPRYYKVNSQFPKREATSFFQ
jgi:hypothetical protein